MEQHTVSLLVAAILLALSTLFSIIAVATPGWNVAHTARLLKFPGTTAAGVLLIIAIVLQAVCLVLLLVFARRVVAQPTNRLKALLLAFTILAGIFIVSAYSDVVWLVNGRVYGYQLAVVSGIFTFLSAIIISYWLGSTSAMV